MLETRALKVAYIFDIRGLVAYELVAYEKKVYPSLEDIETLIRLA